MKPIFTQQHAEQGVYITEKLLKSMAELDPLSALFGLAQTAVFAADATNTPLESVFQFMRDIRKGLAEAKKAEADEPKIIVP